MDNDPSLKPMTHMEIEPSDIRLRRYWLITFLIELPMGILGLCVTIGASYALFLGVFSELLAWGGSAALAQFPFIAAGVAAIMFSNPLHKLLRAAQFIALGILIILIGIWSGDLSSSLFAASFYPEDIFPMLYIGVGIGLLFGIGLNLVLSALDAEAREGNRTSSPNPRHLAFSATAHAILIGLTFGLFFSGMIGLLIGIATGLLAGLGTGGVDLLRYFLNHRGTTSATERSRC